MSKKAFLALAACAALAPPLASAQSAYPQHAIRLIVPHPAGGTSDILARTMAAEMSKDLGQQIVVENKGGANGSIAAQSVAGAAPDGYTLLLATASTHGINPSLYRKLSYDAVKDFTPVTLFATVPNVLVVSEKNPAKTINELVAYVAEHPGVANMASAGAGTPGHLAGEMLKSAKKLSFEHIPYKGGAPAITDLIAGQVDFLFTTIPGAMAHLRAGTLRALAVSSIDRSSALPDVPTVAETAVPGFNAVSWHGLVAPKGTPPEIVDALYKASSSALKSEEVRKRLDQEGARAQGDAPAEFGAFIKEQIATWRGAVEASGATAE